MGKQSSMVIAIGSAQSAITLELDSWEFSCCLQAKSLTDQFRVSVGHWDIAIRYS